MVKNAVNKIFMEVIAVTVEETAGAAKAARNNPSATLSKSSDSLSTFSAVKRMKLMISDRFNFCYTNFCG